MPGKDTLFNILFNIHHWVINIALRAGYIELVPELSLSEIFFLFNAWHRILAPRETLQHYAWGKISQQITSEKHSNVKNVMLNRA